MIKLKLVRSTPSPWTEPEPRSTPSPLDRTKDSVYTLPLDRTRTSDPLNPTRSPLACAVLLLCSGQFCSDPTRETLLLLGCPAADHLVSACTFLLGGPFWANASSRVVLGSCHVGLSTGGASQPASGGWCPHRGGRGPWGLVLAATSAPGHAVHRTCAPVRGHAWREPREVGVVGHLSGHLKGRGYRALPFCGEGSFSPEELPRWPRCAACSPRTVCLSVWDALGGQEATPPSDK